MATMRLRTKVRKLINALGIDAHRYIRQPGKLDFLKQYDIKTVLDIGANVGQSALEFRAILPLAYIYSFEPLPDCLKTHECNARDEHFKAFFSPSARRPATYGAYAPPHRRAISKSIKHTPHGVSARRMEVRRQTLRLNFARPKYYQDGRRVSAML